MNTEEIIEQIDADGRTILCVLFISPRLPANASDAQAGDFILSQTGEQPHDGQSSHHGHGIAGNRCFAQGVPTTRQIGVLQIQSSPE
jgi:hypothetical protein